MRNELMMFEENQVDMIVDENGSVLFELYSTGYALGYGRIKTVRGKEYKEVQKTRIDNTVKRAGISTFPHDGTQYLTEEQLYDFMLEAKTDKCRAFRKWVTSEVLPSIARTGGYIPVTEQDDDMTIMAKALQIMQKTLDKKDELIAMQQPKADYYDKVLNSNRLLSTSDIAKDLGMSAAQLHKKLNERGIIYKRGNTWYPYSKYQHLIPEYMDYHITPYGQQLKWTEKSREAIIDLLK